MIAAVITERVLHHVDALIDFPSGGSVAVAGITLRRVEKISKTIKHDQTHFFMGRTSFAGLAAVSEFPQQRGRTGSLPAHPVAPSLLSV